MTTEKQMMTTNELLQEIINYIDIAIEWAEADYEGAYEAHSKADMSDSQRRLNCLYSAKDNIKDSFITI